MKIIYYDCGYIAAVYLCLAFFLFIHSKSPTTNVDHHYFHPTDVNKYILCVWPHSAHANQNGNNMEKVWLEIRSNEQQKQPQYQQQQQLKSNEATKDSIRGITNSISQESSHHSIQIDARKPVEV